MNLTVMHLTFRSLLGRKRVWLFVALAVILLGLAIIFRLTTGKDDTVAWHLIGGFGLGTIVPLVCLIVGTGAIGTEIDDGSIVYLLAKPIRRRTIILSKLAVACTVSFLLAAVPVLISGLVLAETPVKFAFSCFLGAAAAGFVYSALFLLLSVITRNAAIVGLIYALVWETTVASFVPGARTLSVREWSAAVVERAMGSELAGVVSLKPDVDFAVSVVLLTGVFSGTTFYANRRLQSIRLAVSE